MADSWIFCAKPNPSARVRLYCFPHAGVGPAAFRAWGDGLPPEIEVCGVQLPGRAARLKEKPFTRLTPLAEDAARSIAAHADLPFVFFGHSLGALLAYEVARELRRRGAATPLHLFVSGRRAPQLPHTDPALHHLPDSQFVEEVRRRYDGIPQAVLGEPELMQLMLPALRADFELLETYTYSAEDPLDCPFSAFGGDQDPRVATVDLEAWRTQTRGPFFLRTFPGGHFFIQGAQRQLLEAVTADLAVLRTAAAGAYP